MLRHRTAERDLYLALAERREVADRLDPHRRELRLGHGPHAPELVDGQRVQDFQLLLARDDKHPIRLRQPGADLGVLLAGARAYRRRQPRLLFNLRAQPVRPLTDVFGARVRELGGFHKSLVDGELLDDVHVARDHLEHPTRRRGVHRPARGNKHGFWPDEPGRAVGRHRRARAVLARLVARASDHSPTAHAGDQHRAPLERRAGELFAGRVKRIHIDMQHPARHDPSLNAGLHPQPETLQPAPG